MTSTSFTKFQSQSQTQLQTSGSPKDREDDNQNGLLDGDYVIFDTSQWNNPAHLSPMDIDHDGFVELPFRTDPYVMTKDTTAPSDTFEFTKQRVMKYVITHELGHAVGMTHDTDDQCVMYEYSIDWSRDHCFSDFGSEGCWGEENLEISENDIPRN